MADIEILRKCIENIAKKKPGSLYTEFDAGYDAGLSEAIDIIKETVQGELEP
jgi:tRNA A-37 threonylcarbamoyl transferase component Bud32